MIISQTQGWRLNSDINERNSRYGSLKLVYPRFKWESEGGRSFSVRAARLWNALPNSLKESTNVRSFKKGLVDFYSSSLLKTPIVVQFPNFDAYFLIFDC